MNLEPIGPAGKNAEHRILWRYKCRLCNGALIWARGRVESGAKVDCGCKSNERRAAASTKHGMRSSKEYRAWHGIKDRCLNERSKDYARYGGAGIGLAPEWVNDFPAFFAHIGLAPTGAHQVDRIDSRKGYAPGNVRWATASVQQRNKRTGYIWHIKGVTYETAQEAADIHGVTIQTICRWVNGFTDARRGTTTAPRPDCRRESRYG